MSRGDDLDVLAQVAALPGVSEAANAAREAVDQLLWDRAVLARSAQIITESRIRGAHASASLDGVDADLDGVRSGSLVDDSPLGRALAAALRLSDEVPSLVASFRTSPPQALAAAHAVTAIEFVADDELGRPRRSPVADDPIRLGIVVDPEECAARLRSLSAVLTAPTTASAPVVAAIAHAEIAVIAPFAWGSGLIARAATRLTLASRGVDPDGLGVPEVGMRSLGRSAYVKALREYAGGTPEGVAAWIVHHSEAIRLGARAAV